MSRAIVGGFGPMPPDRGYTRGVAAQQIGENLAFINWTVLTGLAIGSYLAVVLASLRTDATRGYLAFTGACSVVFALLAFFSDRALPATLGGSPVVLDPALDQPRRISSEEHTSEP